MTHDGLPILVEAGITIARRGETYGPPAEHWGRTAAMWTALTDGAYTFTARDVARFYIADKLSRDTFKAGHDHALDIVGYAAGMDGL